MNRVRLTEDVTKNVIDHVTGISDKINVVDGITCPACGNPNIRGHRNGGYIEISCSKCGTSLERPIADDATPLENVVDLVNEYERIRYQVEKSKMEAK